MGILGFPECCVKFFNTYWTTEGWRNLTYPAIKDKETRNHIYNNVLLRHLGVRPVFHLPCSFHCSESAQIGMKVYDLMEHIGFKREAVWSKELVAMPMEWTSLHGVAVLVTPIFKMVYNTDPLHSKATLHLLSDNYPEHGASGTRFPFTSIRSMKFFNGFKTLGGMKQGHEFILTCLPDGISGRILNLGCGDGQLLQAIRGKNPHTVLYGVDNAIKPNVELQIGDEYWIGNIFSWHWDLSFNLTMLAIQRLAEVEKDKADSLLSLIAMHSEKFLLYSYNGWSHNVDDLLDNHFSVVSTNKHLTFEAILFKRKTSPISA